jgi:hypothetical protein
MLLLWFVVMSAWKKETAEMGSSAKAMKIPYPSHLKNDIPNTSK